VHYHYFTLEQRSNLERAIRSAITEQPALGEALRRLHAAEYGVCTRCGADIPYVQLQERPLMRHCARCGAA
jgi:RNA polymerase-binding transcription factor DksA